MPCTSQNRPQNGFTLVELLVVVPVVMATITIFVGTLISMSADVVKTRVENTATYETQNALDYIERDIRLSANFLAGNEFSVSSPLGYTDSSGTANSFTNNGTNGEMLILRGLATDRNPLDPARELIYKDEAGCTATQKVVANYYYINIIYFVKNNTLWRRTLLPTGATCGTPWQKPSCNPAVAKSTTCIVDDVKLTDNVATFTIDYLYNASDASSVASAKDASISITGSGGRNEILRSVSSVRVTIGVQRTAGGKSVTHSGQILTTRLNIPYEAVGT